MRQMEICRMNSKLSQDEENAQESTIVYFVTIDDLTDVASGIILESYGVGVTICQSGESAVIPNVTLSKTSILTLVELLSAYLVTPVSVGDIVDDWLNQ
jgi:hypothetical protein